MKNSIEEFNSLNFLLFNNRDLEVTKSLSINKMKNVTKEEILKLKKIEELSKLISKDYDKIHSKIEIPSYLLDINDIKNDKSKYNDFKYLVNLNFEIFQNVVKDMKFCLLPEDRQWLHKRGLNDSLIEKYKLSSILPEYTHEQLLTIGFTIHPLLTKIFNEDDKRGIIIPLYKDNQLINITIRKINIDEQGNTKSGYMKYSQTFPEIDFWGEEDINNSLDEIWLCEGIFDKLALNSIGKVALSNSNATINTFQMYFLIELLEKNNIRKINFFADNDSVGKKNSIIDKKILTEFGFSCKIFTSPFYKDAAEHFLENKLDINRLIYNEDFDIDELILKNDNSEQIFKLDTFFKNKK